MQPTRTKSMTKKFRSGFTIIELMISTAILSILMLVIFQVWMSNQTATEILSAKIKMRDESRIGVAHMMRNLRMADISSMRYIDGNDDTQDWPPEDDVNGNPTFARGILFQRPVDLDGDGNPYSNTAIAVDWSGVVTFRVDTNDINNDGNTNQVVQLLNNAFVKILINDIAPGNIVQNNGGTLYDTPSVGGFWFTAPNPVANPDLLQVSLVQQRTLGISRGSVFTYYEDFVRIRNDNS